MNDQELREQYERCLEWNDKAQWVYLAQCYAQRGYYANAARCMEKAKHAPKKEAVTK